MKIAHLVDLLRAAELGCSAIEDTAFKSNVTVALAAGMEELRRRSAARKLYKETRPAQTTTRKLIRSQLRLAYSGVRLTRAGPEKNSRTSSTASSSVSKQIEKSPGPGVGTNSRHSTLHLQSINQSRKNVLPGNTSKPTLWYSKSSSAVGFVM